MPITIKGIRIDSVTIERLDENGAVNLKGATYSLISSTDHILATQPIGGYGGIALKPSPATMKALETFMQSYKADVLTVLGLELD
jgi:hypothetical protein